jgi:hypothetical protein
VQKSMLMVLIPVTVMALMWSPRGTSMFPCCGQIQRAIPCHAKFPGCSSRPACSIPDPRSSELGQIPPKLKTYAYRMERRALVCPDDAGLAQIGNTTITAREKGCCAACAFGSSTHMPVLLIHDSRNTLGRNRKLT